MKKPINLKRLSDKEVERLADRARDEYWRRERRQNDLEMQERTRAEQAKNRELTRKCKAAALVAKMAVGTRVVWPAVKDANYPEENCPAIYGTITGLCKAQRAGHLAICYVVEVDAKHWKITRGWAFQEEGSKGRYIVESVETTECRPAAGYKEPAPKPEPKRGLIEWHEHNGIGFTVRSSDLRSSGITLAWDHRPVAFAKKLRKVAAWFDKHSRAHIEAMVD